MTVHRPHPIQGEWAGGTYSDPEEGLILYDDCDRCDEHAQNPLYALDEANTQALWREMVHVEQGAGRYYRSKNEARACGVFYRIAVWIDRTQPHINPWTWPFNPRGVAAVLRARSESPSLCPGPECPEHDGTCA